MGNDPLWLGRYVATCQKGSLAFNSGHVFHLKERGNTFFRNVGTHVPNYTVLCASMVLVLIAVIGTIMFYIRLLLISCISRTVPSECR
jgi:hypothetical protein